VKWKLPENCLQTLKQYRFILLVLAAGICLMLLPVSDAADASSEAVSVGREETAFSLERFERRMAGILSDIEGAGEVQVVFTLKSGSRSILAQDVRQDGEEVAFTTVLVGKQSSQQESVIVQTVSPVFQGALVVCPGGDDPGVRLALIQAVSALTGLGSDRISICKGI